VLITLTGAFKNAGDYLIGHRARTLLGNHLEHEIVDLNRKSLTPESYKLLNSASAVLLTGGPAYQDSIYPGVYNLDLTKLEVPVLAYGLGWKGKLGQTPESFSFKPEAAGFVKQIHQTELYSSARDHLTVEVLNRLGVQNVAMTGCPAWYDESKLDVDYSFSPVKRLMFSMPAVPQESVLPLLKALAKRFPKAEKLIAFNAGYKSTRSKNNAEYTRWNYLTIAKAALLGFKPVSFESDFDKFQTTMSSLDLHIGYRVHSHIFCLSQRITSMLIAEDSRGVGQLQAMGSPVLTSEQPVAELVAALDYLIDSKGEAVSSAIATMRATHPKMLGFIEQLAKL
jgi:hypothetical protein